MITSTEFDSLWQRYNGRIINESYPHFSFWWSRHRSLNGTYTVDYDSLDFGDDDDFGPWAGRTVKPRNQEEYIIEVDALNLNVSLDVDEKTHQMRMKYTPVISEDTIKLYTIQEAYKYFDKVMAISRNLNMPSFNLEVHNKIERYENMQERARWNSHIYIKPNQDEIEKKKDIVYKNF